MTRVNSRELRFRHGQAGATLTAPVGEPAAVKLEARQVPLPEGTQIATVIMRGSSVRCMSHADGLNARGFGFGLSDIAVVDGRLTFRPRFFVHPENSLTAPPRAPTRAR